MTEHFSLFLLRGYGLVLFVVALLWDAKHYQRHLAEAHGTVPAGSGTLLGAGMGRPADVEKENVRLKKQPTGSRHNSRSVPSNCAFSKAWLPIFNGSWPS